MRPPRTAWMFFEAARRVDAAAERRIWRLDVTRPLPWAKQAAAVGRKGIRSVVTDASLSVGLWLAKVSRSGTRRVAGGAGPEQLQRARRIRTPGPRRTHDRAATAGTRMPEPPLVDTARKDVNV